MFNFNKKALSLSLFSFVLLLASCKDNNQTADYKMLCPTGAPALGVCDLILENNCTTTKETAKIPLELQKKNGEYDFIVFDTIKTLNFIDNNKSDYEFVKLITKGNFHLVTFNENADLTDKNANFVSFSANGIIDLTCNYLFENYKNNVNYVNSVADTGPILKTGLYNNRPVDFLITAEPMLTTIKNSNTDENHKIIDLGNITTLLNKKNNKFNFIPQAGLFVKKELKKNNPKIVEEVVKKVETSMFNATNKVDEIVNLINENYKTKEEQSDIFGFNIEIVAQIQKNYNKFGIADYDNTVNLNDINNFKTTIINGK